MAAASEAPIRIVPSYVSSNGYYGYVPPINEPAKHHNNFQDLQQNSQQQQQQQQQPTVCLTNNHNLNGVAAYHLHNQQHYDYNNSLSAMETDEQNFNEDPNCQNNHCVIPEMVRRLNNDDRGGGVGFIYRVTHSNNDSTIPQRGNRKRNSYDDPALLGQMKKLRQGGGNKRVCHGTGSTREHGSTAVYNEPTTLCLVFNKNSSQKYFTSMVDGCCTQAAGNYPLKNDKPREKFHEVRENPITNIYNIDYETMLMETHGCSAYHHHRHHLLGTGTLEAEF